MTTHPHLEGLLARKSASLSGKVEALFTYETNNNWRNGFREAISKVLALMDKHQAIGGADSERLAFLEQAFAAGADLDCDDRRGDADFWWTVAAFRGVELARQIERAEAAEAALAALPGGGVACHRLHTSDGKARWMWVDGPPSLQAADDARNFGWTLELAYALPTPNPHEADRND